jgi:hypothetical protein
MTGYLDADSYGVPGRTLNLSDEFYGALGRIAALSAIIELRLSNVVVLWGKDQSDEGMQAGQLCERFKVIKRERTKAGLEMPDGLSKAVSAGSAAIRERNEVLHSLWPADDLGWRNRPGETAATKFKGVAALKGIIGRMVKAVDGFEPYLRSPID